MKNCIQKEAIKWWEEEIRYGEKCELCIKYYGTERLLDNPHGVYSLTNEEIVHIYVENNKNRQ